jgi:ribosomal protein S12 methylthiotransferase
MIDISKQKIALVSLGCPKNQCDAELMLAKIAKAGYRLVAEPGLADVVVINTCCFIQSAKEEAIEEIMEAITRRNEAEKSSHQSNCKIIITGCLSERYKQQLADEFPEVDGVLALADNDNIVSVIDDTLKNQRVLRFSDLSGHNMEGERLLSTLPHYAFLRISDGCDNKCSYCAIPLFRGRYRERKLSDIVNEAKVLVSGGVREIILIAQDTTAYENLVKLLKELTKIDNLKWIRLLYCYPQRITDELIEVIKTEPKIVKYLDMPIQHCNSEILSSMNRTACDLRGLVKKLRHEIPDIVLRTTVLVGFPGETIEQFTELAEFVHEMRFDYLGCFAYSQEEETSAAEMPDQVDESEKERRTEIILEQQDIRVAELLDGLIGDEYEVVVEGYDKYAELYFGRCCRQAPEIDGMVYFTLDSSGSNSTSKPKPTIGEFVSIRITENFDNNLMGVMQ